jgi:hypothetical protein
MLTRNKQHMDNKEYLGKTKRSSPITGQKAASAAAVQPSPNFRLLSSSSHLHPKEHTSAHLGRVEYVDVLYGW